MGADIDRRWWFVCRLDGDRFEVQLLNDAGAGIEAVAFLVGARDLVLGGRSVPEAVIVTAEGRTLGDGQYCDSAGRLLDHWGNPLSRGAAKGNAAGD